jgi:hypothetical protein
MCQALYFTEKVLGENLVYWAYSPRVVPHFYSVPNRGSLVHTYIPHPRGDRAVEDFVVEVLHDSRGSTLALRLPRIPHLYLDYITLLAICQDLFLPKFIFFRETLGLNLVKREDWRVN